MKEKMIWSLFLLILLVLCSIGYVSVTKNAILEHLYFQVTQKLDDAGAFDEFSSGRMQKEQGVSLDDQEVVSPSNTSLKLNALSGCLIDASNQRVLYDKNGNKRMAMASTTKIMTCIVALESGQLDDVVTVSKYAASMPDVQLGIRENQQFLLKDLLYSLMLESHNDVAVAIAEHIGGSVDGFAKMMNEKANQLGCTNTNFVTPNGLDAENHYTTAVELGKIACYAIQNEQFLEITNTPNWTFKEQGNGKQYQVSNKDRFLYLYDGAFGIKTGFTNRAGYCFVGAAKRDNKTFVSVVLGSGWPPNKNYKWNDTKKLMDYGMTQYEYRQIFDSSRQLEALRVYRGTKQEVNLWMDGDIQLLLREDESVTVEYEMQKMICAPVVSDQLIGYGHYYVGNTLIESVPIYTCQSIKKINFAFCLREVVRSFLGCEEN